MTSRAATVTFVSVLAAALTLRCLLVLVVPFGPRVERRLEGLNDEPAHYNYVKYLAEHGSLPVQTRHVRQPGAFQRGDFEYYQPPLYYMICVPFYALAGERLGLYLCRMVSLASGLLSLMILARILALLDCPRTCRRLGVAFLALLPSHAYFSALVTNDSMSWLVSLLLVHELLALPTEVRTRADSIGLGTHARIGMLIAAGLLTKSAIAVMVPLVLFAYGYVAWRTRNASSLKGLPIVLGIPLVLAGPWHARNLVLYGSLFALDVGFGPVESGRTSLDSIYHTIGSTIRYFWFPMAHVPAGPMVLVLRSVGGMLALIHAAAVIWYFRRRGTMDARNLTLWLLLALTLAGYVRLNSLWSEAEGRFLFPALAAIVFLFVQPIVAYSGRWKAGEALAWTWICLAAIHPWLLLAFA